MDWLKAALGAVGSVFGWMLERLKLNNAPDMREAAKAQKETDNNNKISQEVKNADTNALRNRISP